MKALDAVTEERSSIQNTLDINLHTPTAPLSKAIKLLQPNLTKRGAIPEISDTYTLSHFNQKLTALGKIEEANKSGDIVEKVTLWREDLTKRMNPLNIRMNGNRNKLIFYYDNFYALNKMLSKRYLCRECFETTKNRLLKDAGIEEPEANSLYDAYNLESFVLRNFSEAIHAMSTKIRCTEVIEGWQCSGFLEEQGDYYVCDVCGKTYAKNAVDITSVAAIRAETHIREKINIDLRDIPMEGVLSMEELTMEFAGQGIKWTCAVHKDGGSPLEVNILGDAFSNTAKNIWDIEIIGPVREKVLRAKENAMGHRQTFKSQRLAALPYKEMSTNFDTLMEQINSNIEEATRAIAKLDALKKR